MHDRPAAVVPRAAFEALEPLLRSSPRAHMGKACVRASRRDWKQACCVEMAKYRS